MLYGTGWVIFSGNSTARFAVISFALLVSIALGYVKFVRQRANRVAGSADPVSAPSGEALAGIEARVEALEERASAAAAALGGESHESR